MTTSQLKTQFLNDILNDAAIAQLLEPSGALKNPQELLNNHLFPHWFPEAKTLEAAGVYLGLKLDYPDTAQHDCFRYFQLSVLILCHRSLALLPSNETRMDVLCDALLALWQGGGSAGFRLKLIRSLEEQYDNADYLCRTLTLQSVTNRQDGTRDGG